MNISVIESSIEEAVMVSRQIPELVNPYLEGEYAIRMRGKTSLILVAYADGIAAGFKVGYDKLADGSFYSWMGGVIPAFRNQRVATRLAEHQEQWAKEHGFDSVVFKTRNCHKSMLIFALKSGFSVVGFEPHTSVEQHRIILRKSL